MRFLNWYPGWSFISPWRADVGTGDEALREKPAQTLGKDDERIWPQSNITKIMECKEIKQQCHECNPKERVPNSPGHSYFQFASNIAPQIPM